MVRHLISFINGVKNNFVLYHCGMKKCEVKLQIVFEYNAIVKEWRKKLEDLGDDPTNVNLKSISEVVGGS
jgi:hypothetical protein